MDQDFFKEKKQTIADTRSKLHPPLKYDTLLAYRPGMKNLSTLEAEITYVLLDKKILLEL